MKKKRKNDHLGIKVASLMLSFAALAVMLFFRATQVVPDAVSVPSEVSSPAAPAEMVRNAVPAAAVTPTPEPTPEPEPEYFTISMVGDCTLWSNANYAYHPAGYKGVINGDYSYPFANSVQYTGTDDLTLANLECVLSDKNLTYDYTWATFYFLAPTEYANILIDGGVDFVSTANNHSIDYFDTGRQETYAALDNYGVPYGKEGQSQIITTESGLRVGIYTAGTYMRPDQNTSAVLAAIDEMKQNGAEYIVCMFHWGEESIYKLSDHQTTLAHSCIDAGANLIYGSHSHMVQPVEEYNGGYIFYSLGNWTFGGNTNPRDPDTVLAQIHVKRDIDGTVSNDGFDAIPYCVSSKIAEAQAGSQNYNDYKPTPYEEGSEAYERVMSKLAGTFEADNKPPDYSAYHQSRTG